MSQHWIKSDTIFELKVTPERKANFEWSPSSVTISGFWNKKKKVIEDGWKRYDYSRPVSTEKLLADNKELMLKDESIWYKAELIIHYSTGNKSAHYERMYFKSEDEAAVYAQSIADSFPHIHFQK